MLLYEIWEGNKKEMFYCIVIVVEKCEMCPVSLMQWSQSMTKHFSYFQSQHNIVTSLHNRYQVSDRKTLLGKQWRWWLRLFKTLLFIYKPNSMVWSFVKIASTRRFHRIVILYSFVKNNKVIEKPGTTSENLIKIHSVHVWRGWQLISLYAVQ